MTILFPFAAVTGHEQAKKALLCALVAEDIHSVLITGDRGTGKSVLARSLATLVPERDVLNLPQNITTDRLVGSINIETAISTGSVCHSPGLLEQGDGHILFADDINLMDEGIVSGILNTAETGEIFLEREGLSRQARTRFLLIATMDPAEGELTPAQMDRFDLCVRLDSCVEDGDRAEIIKNHLRFGQDPEKFARLFDEKSAGIKDEIIRARERLFYVSIPDGHAGLISSICLELGVAGQRGDLAAAKTAKALAALDGRDSVEFDDIKLAALLTLDHRRRDIPDSPPADPPPQKPPEQDNRKTDDKAPSGDDDRKDRQNEQQEEEKKEPGPEKSPPVPPLQEQVFAIGSVFEVIRYLDENLRKTTGKQKSGRRTRVISTDASGHYRSFRFPHRNNRDIAIDATLRAAAPYQRVRKKDGIAIAVKKSDLREKVREKKTANTILFLVDASGSMGVRRRMVAVKGAILSLLNDAYQKRDRVGLMVFRGSDARLLLPPTRSPELAIRHLRTMPVGGMTPLTKGIADAYDLLTRGKYAAASENRSIVILTDGRVNVLWKDGSSPYDELADLSKSLAGTGVRFIVVDTEEGYPRLGRAMVLAGNLEGSYFKLEALCSRQLAGVVQDSIYSTG
jgi:magnesium chelatase subunit D